MSDKKNSIPLLDDLMRFRTVILGGEITEASLIELWQRMLSLQLKSSEPITLLIDSGGGSTHDALCLCDLMTTMLHAPVHGLVVGMCGSAATFILLHCDKREGTIHSRYVIHSGTQSEISIPVNGSSVKHLEQLLLELKQVEETVVSMYVRKLGKTRTEVEKLIARGDQDFNSVMTAEEAVKAGLIEGIFTGKLDIFKE